MFRISSHILCLGVVVCTSVSCSTSIRGEATGDGEGPDAAQLADAGPAEVDAGKEDPDAQPGVQIAPCIEGEIRFSDTSDDSCYMLFHTPATWAAAQAACVSLGANLVSIQSESTQAHVALLAEHYPPNNPDLWIGATDGALETSFVWPDGEVMAFTRWRAGEPNDGHNNEDCVVIEGDTPLKEWDDRACDTPLPYICLRTADL